MVLEGIVIVIIQKDALQQKTDRFIQDNDINLLKKTPLTPSRNKYKKPPKNVTH
jgi:hypothetical protein